MGQFLETGSLLHYFYRRKLVAKRCLIRSVRVSIFLRGIALAFDLSTPKNSEYDSHLCFWSFSNLFACSYLNGFLSVRCTYPVYQCAKCCYCTCSLFKYGHSININLQMCLTSKVLFDYVIMFVLRYILAAVDIIL